MPDFKAAPLDLDAHPPTLGARVGVYYRFTPYEGLFLGFGTYLGGRVLLDAGGTVKSTEVLWASEADVQFELGRAGIETFTTPDLAEIRAGAFPHPTEENAYVFEDPGEETIWS